MCKSDKEKVSSEELDAVKELGLCPEKQHGIQCLTIIGQIEGHYSSSDSVKTTKYEHMLPMLVGAEESREIEGLLIILNTIGGDVEAGLAIAELISGMSKPTASIVLGGGHSIGVPLAVAAKRSFIVPSATMTIHPVRTNGLVIGVSQSFEYLQKMQERINDFIIRSSRISSDRLKQLLYKTDELAADVGCILEGSEAVKVGLIDEVGGLSDALEWLHGEIDRSSPLET